MKSSFLFLFLFGKGNFHLYIRAYGILPSTEHIVLEKLSIIHISYARNSCNLEAMNCRVEQVRKSSSTDGDTFVASVCKQWCQWSKDKMEKGLVQEGCDMAWADHGPSEKTIDGGLQGTLGCRECKIQGAHERCKMVVLSSGGKGQVGEWIRSMQIIIC